jgi:mannose-6-phosphate isomerase-like protein (cupin superfamily)
MTKLTIKDSLEKLAQHHGSFIKLFSHGTLEVEIYKPEKIDLQKPHTRDEIYVVSTGSGEFISGNAKGPIATGDVLFVPAGLDHRFVNFSDDFSAWVFFYGPEGGEKGA